MSSAADAKVRSAVSDGHLPALDGLRAVAILSVMVFHMAAGQLDYSTLTEDDIGLFGVDVLRYSLLGRCGVDLFFVLSGFLITGNLLRSRERTGYFKVFYWRRFLRIFPAYYFWLAAIIAAIAYGFPALEHGTLPGYRWWLVTFLSNRLSAMSGWESMPKPLHHFWSLAVEEQFYLAWPLLLFFLTRTRAIAACFLFLVGCLAFRIILTNRGDVTGAYVLTEARMDSLACGALVALVANGPRGLVPSLRWFRIAGLAGLAGLIGIFIVEEGFAPHDPLVETEGYTALSLASMGLLAVCAWPGTTSPIARLLSVRPMRWIGRYSYGLYLIHHPVILLMWEAGWMTRAYQALPTGMPPLLSSWIAFFVFPGIVSLVLALASWHAFEKRFLALKDRMRLGDAAATHSPEVATSGTGGA